ARVPPRRSCRPAPPAALRGLRSLPPIGPGRWSWCLPLRLPGVATPCREQRLFGAGQGRVLEVRCWIRLRLGPPGGHALATATPRYYVLARPRHVLFLPTLPAGGVIPPRGTRAAETNVSVARPGASPARPGPEPLASPRGQFLTAPHSPDPKPARQTCRWL